MKHETQNKYPTKKTLHIRNIDKLEELKQSLREIREKGNRVTDGLVIDLALEYAYELRDHFVTWAKGRLVA